jgi:hypothetical protein
LVRPWARVRLDHRASFSTPRSPQCPGATCRTASGAIAAAAAVVVVAAAVAVAARGAEGLASAHWWLC